MDSTAVTTSPDQPAVTSSPPSRAPGKVAQPFWTQPLTALASLRFTVVLFALSIVLVFFGTLAQIESGVWTVVNTYFRSLYVFIPFQLVVEFGKVFFWFPKTWQVSGSFPFPGGWLLGSLMLLNLLAAHAIRFKMTWKRSGIIVLHAGLIVMMLGELVAGLFAVESTMTIDEGGTANYTYQNRVTELAIVDPSDPKEDEVVVVAGPLLHAAANLKNGVKAWGGKAKELLDDGTIRHDKLPFDIVVEKYMINSVLENAPPADNLANAGVGLRRAAVERPEVSGTSSQQTVEMPSAYVTFKDKKTGEPIKTYMLSLWLINPQELEVDGKKYDISLRFKRDYKPYTLSLIKFRFDRYEGTEMARNFSSQVRLRDPERNENREVTIRMNEPLRYRGEAFFQADFDKETERTTHLQVVRNPGDWLPYISCVMVSLGMLLHFGLNLNEFLRRRIA